MELENGAIKSSNEEMNICKLSEDHQSITEHKMSETSNNLLIHEAEKIIECSICLEVMKDPRKLPCQHAFCYQCLVEHRISMSNLTNNCSNFRCPLCRFTEQIDVNKLPPALIENQFIDLIKDYKRLTKNTKAENSDEDIYVNSRYQLCRQQDEYPISEDLRIITEDNNFELLFFDINTSKEDHYSIRWVLVLNNNKFFVRSKSGFHTFHVYIEGKIVKPQYIRIYRDKLTITGQLTQDGEVSLVLLRCNEKGDILAKLKIYQWSCSTNVQVICGFDFNEKENKYYVCLSGIEQVRVYDFSLTGYDKIFHFENNQPQYVAFSSSNNQLWLSCPLNNNILILDLDREYYKTINTYTMIPMMIYNTENDKIICMDSKNSKLLWIKKVSDKILNQVLFIPMTGDMKLFKTMPTSDIVISNGREIMFFRNSND